MNDPIVITEYNPQWPILYEKEKDQILSVIGHCAIAIEHVGSTSVLGLGAKPIIDIMVAMRQLADASACVVPLQNLGYKYAPEFEALMPERRFFRRFSSGVRTHHLHLVEITSEFWEHHLLFRDFLRNHSESAQQYYQLKQELAAKFHGNRAAYTDAKTQFIESILEKARVGLTILA